MRITHQDQGEMLLTNATTFPQLFPSASLLIGLLILFSSTLINPDIPSELGYIMTFMGVISFTMVTTTTVQISKATSEIVIIRKKLIRKEKEVVNIAEVREIELSYISTFSQRRNRNTNYIAFIKLNGESVPIGAENSDTLTVFSQFKTPKPPVGKKIAEFLGVPYMEGRPLTLEESMESVERTVQKNIDMANQGKKS